MDSVKLWAQPCRPYLGISISKSQITDLKIIKIKIWIAMERCGYKISSIKASK